MALPKDGTLLTIRVSFDTAKAVQEFEKQQRAAFKRVTEARTEDERKTARRGLEASQEFERQRRRIEIAAIEDAHKRRVALINARFESEKRTVRLLLKERVEAAEISAAKAEQEYEQVERNLRRLRDRQLREAPARVAQDRINRRGERPRSIAGAAFAGGAVGAIAADLGRDALFAARDAARELFDLGTAAQETAAKFGEVFGPAVDEANRFVNEFANDAGFTRSELQELTASVGALVQGMGFTQEASAGLSEEVVRLAADLASFNNVQGGAEDVGRRIIQALTGETEAIKAVNIVLRQEEVVRRALLDTGKETAKELTKQERALATLAVITEQAGAANGDLARTKDSTANRVRKLSAELREQREELAIRLIPTFDLVLDVLDAFLSGTEVATGGLVDFVANGVFETVAGLIQLAGQLGMTADLVLSLGTTFGATEAEGLDFANVLGQLGEEVGAVNRFLVGSIQTFLLYRVGLNELRATLLETIGADETAQISRDRAESLLQQAEELRAEGRAREAQAEAREAAIAARRAELQALIDGSGEATANLRAQSEALRKEIVRLLAGREGQGAANTTANADRAFSSLVERQRELQAERIDDEEVREIASIEARYQREREEIERTAAKAREERPDLSISIDEAETQSFAALAEIEAREVQRVRDEAAAERLRKEQETQATLLKLGSNRAEAEAAALDVQSRERIRLIEDETDRAIALAELEFNERARQARAAFVLEQRLIDLGQGSEEEKLARLQAARAAYEQALAEAGLDRIEAVDEAEEAAGDRALQRYEERIRQVGRFTDVLVDNLVLALDFERDFTDAQIALQRAGFAEQRDLLEDQLRNRDLTVAEYEQRKRRLAFETAEFEKAVEQDRFNFVRESIRALRDVAIQVVADQVKEYIAQKTIELLFTQTTEAQRTAVTVAGAKARKVANAVEGESALIVAAKTMVSAVASFIKSVAALPFPFNLAAGATVVGGAIALYNGAKSALGFAEGGAVLPQGGGYTGRGPRQQSAGVGFVEYHRGEVVMEKTIVDGQLGEWMTLRALTQRGMKLADLFRAAGLSGYFDGGSVATLAPVVVPPVRLSSASSQSGDESAAELRAIREQLAQQNRTIAQIGGAAERSAQIAADTRANPPRPVFTRRNAGQASRYGAEFQRGQTQRLGRPNTRLANGRPAREPES